MVTCRRGVYEGAKQRRIFEDLKGAKEGEERKSAGKEGPCELWGGGVDYKI
jgi:hypothetical protein